MGGLLISVILSIYSGIAIIALTLAALMILMVAAGCESTGRQPAAPEGITVIRSIFPGEPPERFDAVLAAINEKMGEDIGVHLHVIPIPSK